MSQFNIIITPQHVKFQNRQFQTASEKLFINAPDKLLADSIQATDLPSESKYQCI